jgi:Spy/CpxP family protein refolding chaperone
MKKNIIILLLSLLVIFLLSFETSKLFLSKQTSTKDADFYSSISKSSWNEILNLNPIQKTKLAKIEKKFSQELLDLRKDLLDKRMNLCQMMMDPKADKEKYYRKMDEICKEQMIQQRKTVDHFMDIKNILSPQQQNKFFNIIMQEMCQGHQMGMGMKNCACMSGVGHHWGK